MGKQTRVNYFPGITKELGIAHCFPSPSCGSRLLSQWSRGIEFIPIPLYSPEKEHQGFRKFLLAYNSGFKVIYHLNHFHCQQKEIWTLSQKKRYIDFFSILSLYLWCYFQLLRNRELIHTDKWILSVHYKNTLICLLSEYLPFLPIKDISEQQRSEENSKCIYCVEMNTIHPYQEFNQMNTSLLFLI